MDKSALKNQNDLSRSFQYPPPPPTGGFLPGKPLEQEWTQNKNISFKWSASFHSDHDDTGIKEIVDDNGAPDIQNDVTAEEDSNLAQVLHETLNLNDSNSSTSSTTNNSFNDPSVMASAAAAGGEIPIAQLPQQPPYCYEHINILPLHMRNLSKTQSLDIVDVDSDNLCDALLIQRDNDNADNIETKPSSTHDDATPLAPCDLANTNPEPDSNSTPIASVTGAAAKAVPPPNKLAEAAANRPIYPNVPYSPYGSPYNSPRTSRRRTPLRESRRISIEHTGSFLQLNQYKLMDQIGQGSFGLVKLAYNEEDSTHYAMKILSKRKLLRKVGLFGRGPKRGISPLDRVYREIAVLKKLDHPNVVKLIEVLDDPQEDSLYLVFELVQQGEVLNIPTDKPLTEERAWSVFRDVLLGLEYLHYQRIIHGDLKPGNLLLGECGQVKIADLGVCNEFMGEDFLNNGSVAGTPAFRAPETLLLGDHSYSGRAADIWAFGATLYSLVYGNVPFQAHSVFSVYEKIRNDELKFPMKPNISEDLKDLLLSMLNKNPAERINLPHIKEHKWVTNNGLYPLSTDEAICRLVQINDDDMSQVVKSIPKLDTLILIKTMLKKHSFQNPFTKGISGRAPQRGGSKLERFSRSGRSNSAPEYHATERQMSSENLLPSLTEGVSTNSNQLNLCDATQTIAEEKVTKT